MDVVVTVLISIVFSILLLKWILNRKRVFSTFERLGIPGPKPSFITGNFSSLIKPYGEVDLVEKYGPIYGFFIGAKPLLAVADPELLRIVQVKEAQIFHARNPFVPHVTIPSSLIDQSVPFATGKHWKDSRDSMTAGYTTSKFKMMNAVLNNELDEALDKIAKFAEKQQSFELNEIYSPLLGHATMKLTFGINSKSMESEVMSNLLKSIERTLLARFNDPTILLSLCFPEIESFLASFRVFRESVRKFFNYSSVENIGEMSEVLIKTRMNDKNNDYKDVIQLMINTFKKKSEFSSVLKDTDYSNYLEKSAMQEEDLLFNSFYLAITTYDLLKHACLYGTYEVAKSPRIQEKLRKEILEINGEKKHISYENLSKMQYLDQVFNEALRMHPTAPLFTNRIAGEDYYYKGQLIPKGTTMYVPQIGMSRSGLNFPDPDVFLPERFEDKTKINPYIYQPFGIGPRHCFGMRVSQYIGKLIFARIVKDYNLTPDPEAKELEPEFRIIIHCTKDPVRILASPA